MPCCPLPSCACPHAFSLHHRGLRMRQAIHRPGADPSISRHASWLLHATSAWQEPGGAQGALQPALDSSRHRHGGFSLQRERSEEHTSELSSLMRISYAVFCFIHILNIHYSHSCFYF